MVNDEIKAVAAELAAVREGKPKRAGSSRKRVLYPAASIARAVRLFRSSGQRPAVFARQLGISAAALSRWAGDNEEAPAFIPILSAGGKDDLDSVSQGLKRSAASAVPTAGLPSQAGGLVVRETVISFPADFDLGRIREIMSALRGGVQC